MDDQRIGAVVREVRRRRGLRQRDLAEAAGVSRATVSLVERGHIASLSLDTLRRISAAVDVRIDLVGRWRGGDLDRLLSRRHSLLAESFAAWVSRMPGWIVEPEVSFAIYGERGIIDQLAWHAEAAHLLLIEFKTELVDINELLGTVDRKRRLIRQIAADRGWQPQHLSVWLIVTDTSTNRRHPGSTLPSCAVVSLMMAGSSAAFCATRPQPYLDSHSGQLPTGIARRQN